MADQSWQNWAAILKVDADRVIIRFPRPVATIGLSASTARQLAARLLILAEGAEPDADPQAMDVERWESEKGPGSCKNGCPRPAVMAGLCDGCIHG